ncbi:MAG TPA: hypothetical protein DIW81_06755 [Planctomycetaceae bacterium]|nr:hypothetical protein [Planctomycetaceae bacterium]
MDASTHPLHRFYARITPVLPDRQFVVTALLGFVGVFWIHLFVTTWGFSSSLGCAVGLSALIAISLPRPQQALVPQLATAILLLLTVTSSFWWAGWEKVLSEAMAGQSTGSLLTVTFCHSLLIILLMICGSWSLNSSLHKSGISANACLGWACGIAISGLMLSAIWPTYWTASFACLIIVGLSMISSPSAETTTAKNTFRGSRGRDSWKSALLLSMALGLLLPALYRFLCQLQPETAFLFYAIIAAFSCSCGLALWAERRVRLLPIAGLLSLVIVAFPLWVRGYLAVSALVSTVSIALLLRACMIFLIVLPAGLLAGHLLAMSHRISSRKNGYAQFYLPAMLLCGLVGVTFSQALIPLIGVPFTAMIVTGILLAVALSRYQASRQITWTYSRSRSQRVGAGLMYAACLSMLLAPLTYSPLLASRALFSTYAFQSWRSGTQLSELPGLDDGRLLKLTETSNGTLSFWKHQGEHVQIRSNGIPQGRISLNAQIVPQPTGALLGAVLPLSMHKAPREVLLIGLESGLGLQTTLEFPVMNVHCCDERADVWEEMQTGVLAHAMQPATADTRVHYRTLSPAMAVRSQLQTYDVIVESPRHSASYPGASQYNEAHYRRLAELLCEEGIYCQRFIFSDYGPSVLTSLAATIQNSFGYMTAFDTAPGEILFVAARRSEDILSEGLIERISTPQVQRALSHVGWDWSVAMNLARFELEDLQSVTDKAKASVFTGTEAFGRCVEMMRWGNKWNEVRDLLAQNPKRLLSHYADEKETDDILRRLSDVAAREQVLEKHPDEFWVYRKSVKKRLLDNPRSVIEPVKGEGIQQKMHPEDKRRLNYFETLGEATQQNPCQLSDLLKVEEFKQPFDPLISHFLHAEIAKLYQRCEPPEPERELEHWLYAVYYGGRQERSVRGIHRALELLNENQKLDPQVKYDHANALMEILRVRWQMRQGHKDISQPVLLIDLKDSLELSQQSLTMMQQIAEENDLNKAETATRVKHLERVLLRTLRSYRTEMLAKASSLPIPPVQQNNNE